MVAKSFLVASGADIAIQDAGSCETSFDAGTIDDTDIQLMLPHFDKLHVIELTGANVLSLISYVTRLKLTKAYPYGAGIRFDINMTVPGMGVFGQRLLSCNIISLIIIKSLRRPLAEC